MKKQFNILLLTILILGQTILGPAGLALASETDSVLESFLVEEQTEKNLSTVQNDSSNGGELGTSNTLEMDEDNSSDASNQELKETDNENDALVSIPENITEDGNQSGKTDDAEKENEANKDENEESNAEESDVDTEKINPLVNQPNVPAEGVMDPETVITGTVFTVGGQKIEGTGPITVKNGDKAEFKFNLELAAGHSFGPGSTLTYALPAIFKDIVFSQGTAFGELGEITKSGNEIKITFNDNIHDGYNGTGFEPGAHFEIEAKFNNTGDNLDEIISLPGQENIKLKFTPINGSAIKKENGAAQPSNQDSEYIKWNVTVNTDLTASGTVTFKDKLTNGHTFKQDSIVITELTMKPDGSSAGSVISGIPSNFHAGNTEMTIDLDGTKAYEITYETIPDDPGNNEIVTYKNSAQYGSAETGTKSATVKYGTPLSKEYSEPNSDLETTWTIKYNHNKRTITQNNAKLKDTWSTSGGSSKGEVKQEMVADSFKVHDGNNQLVALSNYTMTPDADDGQGFELQFNHEVTDAYTITYKTKPADGTFITDTMSVTNKIERTDINLKKETTVKYEKTDFMLSKSAIGTPNYKEKTMEWSIVANQAGYTLNAGTIFLDTFTHKNMTLITETLEVIVDGSVLDQNDYTLEENLKEGFNIKLKNSTDKQVKIVYTTNYDITDIGSNNRQFHNNVAMESSGLPVAPSDSAEHSVVPEQKGNGKKDGKYNYKTKKNEWEVELNFNYNSLTEAVFEDVLPGTQTIDTDSIKVVKGTLDTNGAFQPGNEVNVINTSTEVNKIQFSLGEISEPHKVTYTSHDTDGVFPETASKVEITNNATLKDGNTPNASWTKTVGVNFTDQLIKKKGEQIQSTAGIKWNFEFNYAQSKLGSIVITDKVGKDEDGNPNQLIKADSFKVYKVELSGKSDSSNFAPTVNKVETSDYELEVKIQEGTFEMKLPDGDSAYYIEYETIYMGDNNSTVQNEVSVSYLSEDGNEASNSFSISKFKYGNSGSTVKVPFVVVKTDGEKGTPMEDVEFTLYSEFQPDVALISARTDANGVFDLGMKLTEGNYTLKETTVHGYDNPGDIKFKLHRDSVAKSGVYAGKQIINVENFKEGYSATCTDFKLTIKDIDRYLIANQEVILTNTATGQVHKVITNSEGVVEIPSSGEDKISTGSYTVSTQEEGVLGEIPVLYDGVCEAEIQPAPTCDAFTITVEDKDNIARPGVTVTLKHKTNSNIPEITAKTDSNGKIILPSADTQTGDYKVYENKQYLGNVTITYKNDPCVDTVTEVPTCETFTLVVKDVDGKPREEDVSITIKDLDGNIKETGQTDADGKFITSASLAAGEYMVYEGNSATPFDEFAVNINCEAEVQPAPACSDFTLTVKGSNNQVLANTKVSVKKDKYGSSVHTGTTDASGKIKIPSANLPAGEYYVFAGDLFIKQLTVSYLTTCEATAQGAPVCEDFTLTVQDVYGNARPAVEVTVKDSTGTVIITDTTDASGQLKINTLLPQGTYTVHEGATYINSFTVTDTCAAIVKPPYNGGGGWYPPTPVEPEDPNKPGTEDPNKPGPEDPNKPGTEDPNKPGPEDPNKPGTEDPNKPGPEDPNKPATEDPNKPGPEDPVGPTKPGTGGSTDPNSSGNSGKPGQQNKPGNSGATVETSKPGQLSNLANPNKNNSYQWLKGKKLPQTGEAYPILPLAGGLLLVLAGLWLLRSKKKYA